MKLTNPSRFLVKAKQLSSSLTFTDSLGRHHSGRKGDYLVESSDGVLRIAPKQIFEDIYVPLLAAEMLVTEPDNKKLDTEKPGAWRLDSKKEISEQPVTFLQASPLTRKSPQPYRDRRNPSPGLRSL
jgi:hypothetical protein